MDLHTVGSEEIVVKTPVERFEEDILNERPFLPDTAIYYLELRNNEDGGSDTEVSNLVREGEELQTDADMILDEQITPEQAWKVFCKPQKGAAFAEKFVNYVHKDRKRQEERGFINLVNCLDQTVTIINSTLESDGA